MDEILRTIRNNDPDGKETKPTQSDYIVFDNWILETYGSQVYQIYFGTNWDN